MLVPDSSHQNVSLTSILSLAQDSDVQASCRLPCGTELAFRSIIPRLRGLPLGVVFQKLFEKLLSQSSINDVLSEPALFRSAISFCEKLQRHRFQRSNSSATLISHAQAETAHQFFRSQRTLHQNDVQLLVVGQGQRLFQRKDCRMRNVGRLRTSRPAFARIIIQCVTNGLVGGICADAFDISQEAIETRDRYGRHRWGQSCLLARRLAEAGVAVINVDATAPNNTTKHFSWDDHAGAFHLDYAQRERLPQMDQALTSLVTDLYDRGLQERVLVIACGEFGRTPRVTHAATNFSKQIGLGRDHWPQAFSAFISGGGLRMGQVVGQTNSKSEYPLHDPVTPQDLLATAYRHLGIDFESSIVDFSGRPIPILPHGRPIPQLI